MVFFNKPAGGPDAVGGVFPWTQVSRCWNRSGATRIRGDVVQLALSAAQIATEIASNDSNSYIPGASNDTIWNTVISPQSNAVTLPRSGTLTGAIIGVVLSDSIADNSAGDVQFFGQTFAFVKDAASGDGCVPGQILAPTISNNFSCHIVTNTLISAIFTDSQDATLTNRALKRVFITNGLFSVLAGVTTT